jgi:hypothetical protein
VFADSTKREVARPDEIVLGLDPGYKSLATVVGGARWEEWNELGVTRRGLQRRFGRAFHQAVERATRIHFSLDGIDDVSLAVRSGRGGFRDANMTNAELHYIMSNEAAYNKTVFYRNCVPVFQPFGLFGE